MDVAYLPLKFSSGLALIFLGERFIKNFTHYKSYSSWQFMVDIPHIKFVAHGFIDFSET